MREIATEKTGLSSCLLGIYVMGIKFYFQIGANAGVVGMTKEHLGLALALNVPVFVVVTKIDMCPPNVLQETLKLLQKILKSAGCRKIPVLVQNPDDVVCSATNFSSER
jgi:GTPase